MAVFEYKGVNARREESVEKGTVVAPSDDEARKKLQGLGMGSIQLKRIRGLRGLLKTLTADIR